MAFGILVKTRLSLKSNITSANTCEDHLEKRDVQRTRKLLRVKITNFTPPVQGACLDVSSTGMRIKIRSKRLFNTAAPLELIVVDHQAEHLLGARLVWTRRTVLETLVGVHFTRVPMAFLRDVLKVEPGSENLPFIINLSGLPDEKVEFLQNLKFGGVIIKDQPGVQSPVRPEMYREVFVRVLPGNSGEPVDFKASVVSHLPFGIGLRVDEVDQILARFK